MTEPTPVAIDEAVATVTGLLRILRPGQQVRIFVLPDDPGSYNVTVGSLAASAMAHPFLGFAPDGHFVTAPSLAEAVERAAADATP